MIVQTHLVSSRFLIFKGVEDIPTASTRSFRTSEKIHEKILCGRIWLYNSATMRLGKMRKIFQKRKFARLTRLSRVPRTTSKSRWSKVAKRSTTSCITKSNSSARQNPRGRPFLVNESVDYIVFTSILEISDVEAIKAWEEEQFDENQNDEEGLEKEVEYTVEVRCRPTFWGVPSGLDSFQLIIERYKR